MKQSSFKIYILEDDTWYNKLLSHAAGTNPDFEIHSFFSAAELYAALNTKPNVVTVDYRLPDASGKEVLYKVKELLPDTEVIVISEQENVETAVELLKQGAYDYLVKEKTIKDKLISVLSHLYKNYNLRERVEHLETELKIKAGFSNRLIGESEGIIKVTQLIEKAANHAITVMISGETGTGKEVVANLIHQHSTRKNKAFVAVNVAAIPSELVESELFGHEKGAFTGALNRRIGKFEEADGGTLFLDEIGEMSLQMQAKLLRALQEKEITRLGSNTTTKVDCRIIVATHRDLRKEIKNGNFREDLYFRLFGLTIELPPLRERENDAILIAKYFIERFCEDNKMPLKKLSAAASKKLLAYSFPGNVRELKSVIDLACVLCDATIIEPEHLQIISESSVLSLQNEERTLKQYEVLIIKEYLRKYNKNLKLVAEKLDIGLSTLYRLLKEYSIDN